MCPYFEQYLPTSGESVQSLSLSASAPSEWPAVPQSIFSSVLYGHTINEAFRLVSGKKRIVKGSAVVSCREQPHCETFVFFN